MSLGNEAELACQCDSLHTVLESELNLYRSGFPAKLTASGFSFVRLSLGFSLLLGQLLRLRFLRSGRLFALHRPAWWYRVSGKLCVYWGL